MALYINGCVFVDTNSYWVDPQITDKNEFCQRLTVNIQKEAILDHIIGDL